MKPNIIFLVIDSLRADKFYGDSKSSKTPNIDSLINKGVFFNNAISSSDVTGICLGNIFTGMYSFKTGITLRQYNQKIPTFFDALKQHGYNLYSIIPDLTWFHKLTKNFDEKDDYYVANLVQDDLTDKVGNLILDRLDSIKEPWFYYVHLEDLHDKIIVPKNFDNNKYGDTSYERMVSVIDIWIGKILEKTDLDNTLLIITADHGEFIRSVDGVGKIPNVQAVMKKGKELFPILEPIGLKIFIKIRDLVKFFQMRKLKKVLTNEQIRTLTPKGHKILYDDYIHVPLLFVGYGIKSNKIIDNLVTGVDIFPTIFQICNLDYKTKHLDGRNLFPLFNNAKVPEVPIFIVSGDAAENKESVAIGIRTSKYKYLRNRNDSTKDVVLFDLEKDPFEHDNISNLHPDIVKDMENTLSLMTKQSLKDEQEKLTEQETKKIAGELRKLGYI